jgi:hypothetical protein
MPAIALVLLASVSARPAHAQIPSPPHRYYGQVRINNGTPPDGTTVAALIGTRECGRTVTAGGAYRLDVIAASMRPGCGAGGVPIWFRVGGMLAKQTGAWRGAAFTSLDLDIEAPPYTAAVLDLTSPCIPAGGRAACDAARLALWNGDPDTWALLFHALGSPAPGRDRVFDEVLKLRLEAGDPALTGMVARMMGWPYLKITAIRFQGSAPGEADEFVEISNLGGAAQPMDGWRLRAEPSGAEFRFQSGWSLAAGSRCRIYTNEAHPDSCPGLGFGAGAGVWDDSSGSAILSVDFPSLTADRARYMADPLRQPPPPALRGDTATY